jgi:hypothetical protein
MDARIETIVAKASLDSVLVARLREWGVAESSMTRSCDASPRSHAEADNVTRYSRIETIVSYETAQKIARELAAEFCGESSAACFVSDVSDHLTARDMNVSSRYGRSSRALRWGDYLVTI